jgi:hypothetical protein
MLSTTSENARGVDVVMGPCRRRRGCRGSGGVEPMLSATSENAREVVLVKTVSSTTSENQG